MIPMKDLLNVTGYIRGACSPLGMKKHFLTFIHETCLNFEEIYDQLGAEEGAKGTILADAMEATIGAVYLDGGLEAAKNLIHTVCSQKITSTKSPPKDHKSALQEWSQKLKLGVPEYTVVEMSGPAHAPRFIVEAKIQDHASTAEGASKRVAEQEAAKLLLEKVSK